MNTPASFPVDSERPPTRFRPWIGVLVIWLLILAAYVATDRPLRIVDIEGVALLPVSIWQEGNLDLDEYAEQLGPKKIARQHQGRLVSSFPIWPAFQLLPVYLATGVVDRFPAGEGIWPAQRHAAQFYMSLTTLLVGWLAAREYGRLTGILVGFAFGFGTINWFVLSQLAFSNGLVQFWLALALVLTFSRGDLATWKTVLAFCALVVTVFMRLHMVLLALPWMIYLCFRLRRRALVPAAAAALFAATLALVNLGQSGHPLGMYGRHISKGWIELPTMDLITTLSANLVSPARGLIIFSPWVLLALAAPLLTRGRRRVMQSILLGGWILHLLALANHKYWHGGGSGGPRLTADLLPVLALLAAPAIAALMDRKTLAWIPVLLVAASAVISGAHAFSPPPVWESYTVPVRICPARLFDWGDALVTFPFRDQSQPYEQRFPVQLLTPRREEVVKGPTASFRWAEFPGEELNYSVELCVRLRNNTFCPRVFSSPAGRCLFLDLDHREMPRFNPGPMAWRVTGTNSAGRMAAHSGWRAFWWNHGHPVKEGAGTGQTINPGGEPGSVPVREAWSGR